VTTISAPAHKRKPKAKMTSRHLVSYKLSRKARLMIAVRGPRGGQGAVRTTVRRATRAGKVSLARLVHGRRLKAGTYRVTATAIDSSGAKSKPRRTRFRVRFG
jgi:hypothetical protein